MKIKVKEIGWGICKDDNGSKYVGVGDGRVMDIEMGDLYKISQRDENENVIEIESK